MFQNFKLCFLCKILKQHFTIEYIVLIDKYKIKF